MSCGLTQSDIESDLFIRWEKSNDWGKKFEKNYKSFSQKLALSFANFVNEAFRNKIRDPYFSLDKKFTATLSLNITNHESAEKIKELMSPDLRNFPPFDQWLERFSTEKNEINLERAYFAVKMKIVADRVEKELKLFFPTSTTSNNKLQYKLKRSTSTYHGLDTYLFIISLWLKQESQSEQKPDCCPKSFSVNGELF